MDIHKGLGMEFEFSTFKNTCFIKKVMATLQVLFFYKSCVIKV